MYIYIYVYIYIPTSIHTYRLYILSLHTRPHTLICRKMSPSQVLRDSKAFKTQDLQYQSIERYNI